MLEGDILVQNAGAEASLYELGAGEFGNTVYTLGSFKGHQVRKGKPSNSLSR